MAEQNNRKKQDRNGGKERRKESGRSPDREGLPEREPGAPLEGGLGGMFRRFGPLLLIVAAFLIPWVVGLFTGEGGNRISYTQFRTELENGNIESVTISGPRITGSFQDPQSANGGAVSETFITNYPQGVSEDLVDTLLGQDVAVTATPPSDGNFLTVLLNLLPFLLMIWIFVAIYRNMRSQGRGGGMFQFGNMRKNKAKRFSKSKATTTFDDVAGADSAKKQLTEVVAFLKEPKRFQKFGARTPRGMLLVGAPGTGKTLLARAVAGEADVPFFHITGSDFMEMFVGVGASRVRDLFSDAKKEAPSIIFIDELDSIGRSRGAGLGGGHDEREQTLNQLLSELDGFEPNESAIVIAATNRPDILDPALLRPGRFDRRITINMPTTKDRLAILKIHARGKPMSEDAELESLARSTPGFSGADLANLVNEAALIAASREHRKITNEDLDAARDKVVLGLERPSVVMSDDEKKIVAYHEAGHALVAAVLPGTDPLHKVSIVPHERSMGATEQLPERERYIYRKEYLESRLSVMMGGRAAETLVFDTMTSGAEQDLKQGQRLARKMVLDWGMAEDIANVAFGSEEKAVFLGEQLGHGKDYSDEIAHQIDTAVRGILRDAFERATDVLSEHRESLDELAERLVDEEEVDGSVVYELTGTKQGS